MNCCIHRTLCFPAAAFCELFPAILRCASSFGSVPGLHPLLCRRLQLWHIVSKKVCVQGGGVSFESLRAWGRGKGLRCQGVYGRRSATAPYAPAAPTVNQSNLGPKSPIGG